MKETIYKLQEDGTFEVTEKTIETPPGFSVEEQIADKEAQLLKMYQELEALKASQEA